MTPQQRAAFIAIESAAVAIEAARAALVEAARVLRASLEPADADPDPDPADPPVEGPAPEPPPVDPPVEPPAPEPPAPPAEPPAPIPAPTGKYRHEQPLLFQGARDPLPSLLPGGPPYVDGVNCGPTRDYVDSGAGWPWLNRGGDWVDADGVPQGNKPWAAWTQPALLAAGQVQAVSVDVTRLAQRDGWAAWRLACPRAQARKVRTTGALRPAVIYTYTDGEVDQQVATVCAGTSAGEVPQMRLDPLSLPAFLEFRRPRKAVASAELRFSFTDGQFMSQGGPAVFEVFPLVPPVNTDAPTTGVAAAHPLDEGLAQQPGVIHVHRYVAGSQLQDFIHPVPLNTADEANFDPAIADPTKAPDLSKLPHAGYGRWVGADQRWSLVQPQDLGYPPLHRNLGALRIPMRKAQIGGRDIRTGDVVGYGGSEYANAFLFLPSARMWRQRRLFTRYVLRISYPDGLPGPGDRLQYYTQAVGGQSKWAECGGKFSMTPGGCANSMGGYSGSAGAGNGTQFRAGWGECLEGLGGPGEGGWYASWHLFDYNHRSLPGHVYALSAKRDVAWGQRGGLGAVLYADRFYDIEQEVLLNSVDQPAVLPDGSPHLVNGVRQFWTPDGELRVWIDGRLAFERTGMAFRSLPATAYPYRKGFTRPLLELGHIAAGLNVFQGGVTQNCINRVLDITGLVVAEQRIGPLVVPQ